MSKVGRFSFTKIQTCLLITPPVLLATTYIVYGLLAELLGSANGYLGGFLFYWIIWCSLFPIVLIGPKNITKMFRDTNQLFGKPSWVGVLFLAGPIVAPLFTIFLPQIGEVSFLIVLVSALFAIINGTMEEVLWRGTFITAFPNSWLWSYLYPSIWFGYWHLSPQIIFPSQMPGGAFAFATMSIFMGLTFGWMPRKANQFA